MRAVPGQGRLGSHIETSKDIAGLMACQANYAGRHAHTLQLPQQQQRPVVPRVPPAPNPTGLAGPLTPTLPPQQQPHQPPPHLLSSPAPHDACKHPSTGTGTRSVSCTASDSSCDSIRSSTRSIRTSQLGWRPAKGDPRSARSDPLGPPGSPVAPPLSRASGPSAGLPVSESAMAEVAATSMGRRAWLAAVACLAMSWAADSRDGSGSGSGRGGWNPFGGRPAHAAAAAVSTAAAGSAVDLSTLQEEAYLAYAERRFQDAVNLLTECIEAEPQSVRWREMRAEALVDGKNFPAAIRDFEAGLALVPDVDLVTRARLLTGRALAYEGLSEWEAALVDYQKGMDMAAEAGESLDPYVLNSIGNCLNSLGRWEEAREQYLASSEVFQRARGFRGRNGSTTPRLDGAIFAASNAALMRAQLGDTDGAVQEMVRIARRAPGSADMRAALAALYWSQGRRQEAEEMWEFACDRITVGCAKYSDMDWLGRIRRWPPAMVARMADFLAMR